MNGWRLVSAPLEDQGRILNILLFLHHSVRYTGKKAKRVAFLSQKIETRKATDGKAPVAFLPGCLFAGEPSVPLFCQFLPLSLFATSSCSDSDASSADSEVSTASSTVKRVDNVEKNGEKEKNGVSSVFLSQSKNLNGLTSSFLPQ